MERWSIQVLSSIAMLIYRAVTQCDKVFPVYRPLCILCFSKAIMCAHSVYTIQVITYAIQFNNGIGLEGDFDT